ncbi:MAG TPA: GNAT family N-acetyltransferase [Gemmatimonadaceae bacterium]|nr:GNAT family N-acetyltransferase [Gemmatimonadaceae bacterium]
MTKVTRTFFQLTSSGELVRGRMVPATSARVERCFPVSAEHFRELYAQVGSTYRWHDRDEWSDARVVERFATERVTLYELTIDGERAGFYELECHDDGSVEIVLFGLLAEFAGRGLGRWLLVEAVERAWSMGAARVWLHTCTLDSRAAIPNYLARGFRPYATEEFEIED